MNWLLIRFSRSWVVTFIWLSVKVRRWCRCRFQSVWRKWLFAGYVRFISDRRYINSNRIAVSSCSWRASRSRLDVLQDELHDDLMWPVAVERVKEDTLVYYSVAWEVAIIGCLHDPANV